MLCLFVVSNFIVDLCIVAKYKLYTGVVRGCATASKDECVLKTNASIPELGYTHATGEFCYCSGDLCNSAPQTSVGRTAATFLVTSLLALAAARFLSQ